MTGRRGTLVRGKQVHRRAAERPADSAGLKGGFRITLADGSWWWSPGMYLLHGLPADQIGRVVPTTRLVLAHRHPADRVAVARAWAHLIAEGNLVAARYRIIGFDGVVRPVYAMASTDQQSGRAPTIVTGVLQLEAPAAG